MRKKSKIYFLILFLSFFIFPFTCNAQTGHNGFGLFKPGSSVTGEKGLVHNQAGVRLTMVDSNGNKLPGTISADYWSGNNTPQNAEMLSGSSYRTKHINASGSDLTTGITAYKANVFDESHIGSASSSSWYNRDNVLHETMMRAIDRTNSKKKCVSTTFFVDMNFKLCDLFEGKCADLKKYYILIEPLLFINVNGHDIVVTGTEYTALIDKLYPSNDDLIYDLRGGSGYGNALLGMFLSKYDKKDSTDYDLKSKGKVYTIPTDSSQKNYSGYDEDIQNNSYRKPYGYSMQIVWLGDLAKDCEPNCCVPCNTDDDGLRKYIAEGGICDSNNCEGETEIATGVDDKGLLVCEKKQLPPYDCCVPCNTKDADLINYINEGGNCDRNNCSGQPTVATGIENGTFVCEPNIPDEPNCDDPDWKRDHPEEWEKYCSTDDSCPNPTLEPEIVLGVCTDDNSETMSYFRDGVFNSKNGQLKDYNTFEKLTSSDILDENDEINQDVLSQIASSGITDNSFQALARMKDSQYSTKINQYCWMHCQELFDVQLPDNYPLVYSGRYFRWTIKDSEDTIAKAGGAKLCAVDIDLDRIIDEYLMYSENAKLAAENEAQFKLYVSGFDNVFDRGVGVSSEKKPNGAVFDSCGDLQDKFAASTSVNNQKVGRYVEDILFGDNDDVRYFADSEKVQDTVCRNARGELVRGVEYVVRYSSTFTAADALKNHLFNGGVVYRYTGTEEMPMYFNTCDMPKSIVAPEFKIGFQPNEIMLSENGEAEPGQKGSAATICGIVSSNYEKYIVNYSENINSLINSLKECQQTGEILINMGTELTYQTLFNQHTYSTISSDNGTESIIKEHSDENSVNYDGEGCFDGKGICEPQEEYGEFNTSYYTLDGTQRVLNTYFTCTSSSVWENQKENVTDDFDYKGHKLEVFQSPDKIFNTMYGKEMSYFNNIDVGGGYFLQNSDNTKISLIDDDGKSLWNTVYASIVSTEDLYKLDDAINACVCKDGYVQNKTEEGTCECTKTITYNDFTGTVIDDEYNSYGTLEYGTLTVEFMNGSGLYPIDLKYWTLGSVESEDSTNGHFDEIALNSQYYDSDHMCFEDGIYTSCTYDDPNGVCRFKVKNKIIIEKDDTGECDDPPCNPEPDDTGECDPTVEPCDTNPGPEDLGECIVDGNPVEECRELAGLNAIYRLVDTSNPFPNRQPGANWVGNESIIEFKSTEPIYSATLTPASIKAIRRSSLNVDYTVGSVIFENGNLRDGKSYFLREQLPELMDRDLQNRDTFINTLGGMS